MNKVMITLLLTATFVALTPLIALGIITLLIPSLIIVGLLAILLMLIMRNKKHGPEYPKDYDEYRGCAASQSC